MSRTFFRSSLAVFARVASATVVVGLAAACHEGIDTTRRAPKPATLGDDLYGLLCDRVGASSLTEDLTGESYQEVCHYDDKGKYADKVKAKLLPPVTGDKAKRSRRLGVAKIEAMARRRTELIRAFNAAFPDVKIPDPTAKKAGATVRLHDALMSFSQDLAPLYESNPYDPKAPPLFPTSTRSLGRLFDALATSDAARDALVRMGERQAYRPLHVALGAIRPALSYPDLRNLSRTTLEVLGPDGPAAAALQQLLVVSKNELNNSRPVVALLPNVVVDASKAQPNRPRTNSEVAAALLLGEHASFASPGTAPYFLARRDRRGFVLPDGNVPGKPGTVPAPFADGDGDGFADVDPFGRFLDGAGQPLDLAPPFSLPGTVDAAIDVFGRPDAGLYRYVDTSRTVGAALARSVRPLLDPTRYAEPGDPQAYRSESETLMYTLAGAYLQYGDREPAEYDHENESILEPGAGCPTCTPYLRFRGEDSPVADLAHATGQILADRDSDVLLLGLVDLLQNHEDTIARLVGAALEVRRISLQHDALAAQGKEHLAELPYKTPIWDEMAGVLGKIASRPGLVRRLLVSFGDSELVKPRPGGVKHMGETLSRLSVFRDEMTYDPYNVNGPALNLTVGAPSTADPKSPIDPSKPRSGKNRSILERSLATIHDCNGVKGCNKPGAKVYAPYFGGVTYGNYAECELFEFPNLAAFYLDALLGPNHPKRSELRIKNNTLSGLLSFAQSVGLSIDGLFENASKIDGMTLEPGPVALNRLVFFGADSNKFPNMPDLDPFRFSTNKDTNSFIFNLIDPISTAGCPLKPNGVANCPTPANVLRVRDANVIFTWERFGFYDYLRPIVTAFANESCAADLSWCDVTDVSAEQLFVDIIDILNRHWPGPDHGPECEKNGTPQNNARYCSEAGINRYEPLLGDAFASDLVPAVVEFARVASELSTVTVRRGPDTGKVWSGGDVLERLTRILFDPGYAAEVKMVDRNGQKAATWVDGTKQPQLTAFSLFADGLHGIDVRFDRACRCDGLEGPGLAACESELEACRADVEERKAQWKRGRSQFVDAFFDVTGTGATARFRNRATPQVLVSLLGVLREQLNANCPTRESTGDCRWAKVDIGRKIEEVLSGPLFAALMDVQEALRAHEPARRSVEGLLSHMLDGGTPDASLQGLLASASDIVQILADDTNFAPLFNAASVAANPAGDEDGPGCADTTLRVLEALSSDAFDRYHVLEVVLPSLVTPMESGATPIEVFMDVIGDVNRIDASLADPLDDADYDAVLGTVRDFLIDPTRGLEQFYFIVQNRPRE